MDDSRSSTSSLSVGTLIADRKRRATKMTDVRVVERCHDDIPQYSSSRLEQQRFFFCVFVFANTPGSQAQEPEGNYGVGIPDVFLPKYLAYRDAQLASGTPDVMRIRSATSRDCRHPSSTWRERRPSISRLAHSRSA